MISMPRHRFINVGVCAVWGGAAVQAFRDRWRQERKGDLAVLNALVVPLLYIWNLRLSMVLAMNILHIHVFPSPFSREGACFT